MVLYVVSVVYDNRLSNVEDVALVQLGLRAGLLK